jgi:hypothetical protein
MNEQKDLSSLPEALREELKQLIREGVREELSVISGATLPGNRDELLTPEQAAEILGQDVRWLYRHAKKLPFTRRISRKNLRFSEAGLRRWIAAKKPDYPR